MSGYGIDYYARARKNYAVISNGKTVREFWGRENAIAWAEDNGHESVKWFPLGEGDSGTSVWDRTDT